MTAHNIHQLHSHNLCVTYLTGELGSLKSFEYHDVFGVELNSAEWVTAPLSLTHPQQVCAAQKKVRETIERMHLSPYGMLKQHKDSWEYELTIAYQDDQNLDQQIEDLLVEMDVQADLEDCFIEADVTEIGTERSW